MKFGVYYSSLFDWAYNPHPEPKKGLGKYASNLALEHWSYMHYPAKEDLVAIQRGEKEPAYTHYCEGHWRELIEKCHPSILWSDIGYPPTRRLETLMADFYNATEEVYWMIDGGLANQFLHITKMRKKRD